MNVASQGSVTTSPAMARNDPACFPTTPTTFLDAREPTPGACKGYHEKYIAGAGGAHTDCARSAGRATSLPLRSCAHARGLARALRVCGADLYSLIKSPVVKIVSEASTPGDTRSMTPPLHRSLVLTDGESSRWELPPLATVTLRSVHPPGEWGAFEAARVHRTLYVCTVEWMASVDRRRDTPPAGALQGEAAPGEAMATALEIS